MKRLFKMLSLLSILLILGSCDSSKNVIGIESTVPDGMIAIKIFVDRDSFLGEMDLTPDDYNSDIELYLKNVTQNTTYKAVGINQSIIVNSNEEFELIGTYDKVGGGYSNFTLARFKSLLYDSQSRTLRVTIKAVVNSSNVVTGSRITTAPM